MLRNKLPQSVLGYMYEYDPTFYEYFKKVAEGMRLHMMYDPVCGLWIECRQNGEGSRHGRCRIFYQDEEGHFKLLRELAYKNGVKHGRGRLYYCCSNSKSKKKVCTEYFFYRGKLHGPYRLFDKSGEVVFECHYVYGKKV